eukprot:CAMPEP_0177632304 /NCGR_PEP_ID=MMETSP0447-20121125/2217_1 /TAXON_ID=0 /ORGANISM="Stygamoeba regulata, Strain BSH-02190019" /LENGTH=120 /DNA_ID=CAMNT_0019133857 /DNA_START=176 /DNA_END=535 /DNA_ORIENTATION=+
MHDVGWVISADHPALATLRRCARVFTQVDSPDGDDEEKKLVEAIKESYTKLPFQGSAVLRIPSEFSCGYCGVRLKAKTEYGKGKLAGNWFVGVGVIVNIDLHKYIVRKTAVLEKKILKSW